MLRSPKSKIKSVEKENNNKGTNCSGEKVRMFHWKVLKQSRKTTMTLYKQCEQ